MQLVYSATKKPVKVGDEVTINAENAIIDSIEKPRHGGSTGRIYIKHKEFGWTSSYFPSVFGAEWIERTDQ